MRVVISGGSNSLRKGGYAKYLISAFGGRTEVVNISLGAAPSLMGFFQQCRSGNLQPGDILVFEYALNDLNHIAQKGYRSIDLLRYVELILRNCTRRKVRIQPVIMRPLGFERSAAVPKFHAQLQGLFEHYGVSYLDVSSLARNKLGVSRLSKEHYDDVNHYKADGEVVRLVANELLCRINECNVPLPSPTLYCGDDQSLETITELQGGTRSVFANSTGAVQSYRPDHAPLTLAVQKDAVLVGMVVLAGTRGGVLRVECKQQTFLLSLQHDHSGFDKPLVKLISLDNLLQAPLGVKRGEVISVSWSDTQDGALIDLGFRPPGSSNASLREGGVVGFIFELGIRPQKSLIKEPLKPVKGVDRWLEHSVEQSQVVSNEVSAMNKSGPFAGKNANDPIDAEGFMHLLDAVQRFTTAVERMLRQVAPQITLSEYLTLKAIADTGAEESAVVPVKPAMVKRLVGLGYITQKAQTEGHEPTEKGRAALDGVSLLIKEVAAQFGEGEHPISAVTARPLVRATVELRKFNGTRAA